MTKPTALIVDDIKAEAEVLEHLLSLRNDVDIIALETKPEKAIELIIKKNPDLVFMDIEMPNLTGFDVVNQIKENGINPTLIFTTGYNDYAIKAIKHAAFDYLLKPIDIDTLNETLDRYFSTNKINNFDLKVQKLVEKLESRKIKFNTRTGFILVELDEIAYFEAEGSYTRVFFINNEKELLTLTMHQVEKQLEDFEFIRTRRDFLVNLKYITSVNRRTRTCLMKYNGQTLELPISRRHMKEFDESRFIK
jgi:two-component system LytT family response regulator